MTYKRPGISECVCEERVKALIKDFEAHRLEVAARLGTSLTKPDRIWTHTINKKYGSRVKSIRYQGSLIKNRKEVGEILYNYGFQLAAYGPESDRCWEEYFRTGTLTIWK